MLSVASAAIGLASIYPSVLPRRSGRLGGSDSIPSCNSSVIWNQKVEPRFNWLWKQISPPISFTSFWVITSPRPVPPWRREMLASA
ncbi:hypothetical protein D3C79_957310 [compost metagenome]